RYFGFHALLSNTEGGLVNGDRLGDDYAMYSGVEDPRFKMVTHDMDTILSLGQVQRTIFAATNIPALRRMIYHPDILPRYFEQLRDMIQNVLHSPRAEMALRESLRGVSSENDIQRMLQFLQARGDYVLSLIPNEVTVSPFLESGRDYWETDSASLALVGTANYDAQSVTVNGRIATLSTDRSWQYGNYVTTIVSTSSTWRYLDNGSNQGTAWRELDFVPDNSWGEGQSQLGYGDNDERTVVGFGDDPNNKHVTTYFRHEFNIPDASQYLTMDMGIIRDDGAAVYLNGQEIARLSLPDNADYQTLASDNLTGGSERSYTFIDLDPALLNDGKNVIAVEIHQAAVDSDDISMQLFVRGRYQPRNVTDLVPGVNRVTVRSMSGPDGTGEVLDETHLDVWYKGGTPTTVSGTLPSGQTTWTTANSPYLVTSDVVVPADGTLVIEPGTSVYFAPDTELRIEGMLEANGTADARIRFTAAPGQALVADEPGGRPGLPAAPPKWDGIHLVDSRAANSIRYVDVEHAQDSEGSIGVINSNAVISNVTVAGTHIRMIYGSNASMILENSVFPDMFAENESPAALGLDNISEHVKLIGRPPRDTGQLIIRNNVFGSNKGHNDVIDADSYQKGQGPLLQIIGNWFRGAGDELLDLGGDVYVAENFFQNVFKDDETSDRGYANAISTGDAGTDTTIVVARNVFYDVDHAINLKNSAATIFENNTVVTVHPDFNDRFNNPNVGSAINLYVDEPGARPGRGAYAAGNIFYDVPRVFGNADLPDETVSSLRLVGNVLDANVANSSVASRPGTVLNLGSQNRIGDARVSGIAAGDISLHAGSAAFNAYLGQDAGADVPPGAWITSSVQSPTAADTVQFTVGGPGIFAYQYRVNGGAWSDVRDIGNGFDGVNTVRTDTLTLSGLTNGNYVVEVQGQDFAGNWISQHLDSIEFAVQSNTS
ncbi:MAG: hypothetical protein KDA87_23975, partial [Planctomycetales bacterium]|nr:hypothetical protein [Planctomycetales bacterium]